MSEVKVWVDEEKKEVAFCMSLKTLGVMSRALDMLSHDLHSISFMVETLEKQVSTVFSDIERDMNNEDAGTDKATDAEA